MASELPYRIGDLVRITGERQVRNHGHGSSIAPLLGVTGSKGVVVRVTHMVVSVLLDDGKHRDEIVHMDVGCVEPAPANPRRPKLR